MIFRLILFVWAFVLDLAAVSRLAEDEKDLDIMLLRQQLRMVERKQPRGPHLPRGSSHRCGGPPRSNRTLDIQLVRF